MKIKGKEIKEKKPKDKLHSNNVMLLLKEKDMTQQELSDLTGIYTTHLSKIIKGQRRCISLPIAIKISRALNEPIEKVFIYKSKEELQ
jgi:DNA-binding XRE family transcriptional regulator